jgi:hypothetical protein
MECWSCRSEITVPSVLANDGICPSCNNAEMEWSLTAEELDKKNSDILDAIESAECMADIAKILREHER